LAVFEVGDNEAVPKKRCLETGNLATLLGLIREAIFDTSIRQDMKVLPKRPVAFRRCIALALSSLFLLFLSLSQPHRVHHFFQRLGHAHGDTQVDSDNHDHAQDQSKPAQTDCAVQSVAQNCHLGQAELAALPFIEWHLESFEPQTNHRVRDQDVEKSDELYVAGKGSGRAKTTRIRQGRYIAEKQPVFWATLSCLA
jgi:hypothetical protein